MSVKFEMVHWYSFSLSGSLAGAGFAGWTGLVAFGLHLAWQIARIEPADTARSLALFRANRDAGLILFAGLAIDALIS